MDEPFDRLGRAGQATGTAARGFIANAFGMELQLPIIYIQHVNQDANALFFVKNSAGCQLHPKLIEELQRFKYRLPEKFIYLTEAPSHDPNGNPSIVRFSRKNKEQYVTSEVNGKSTGWVMKYVHGKWVDSKK